MPRPRRLVAATAVLIALGAALGLYEGSPGRAAPTAEPLWPALPTTAEGAQLPLTATERPPAGHALIPVGAGALDPPSRQPALTVVIPSTHAAALSAEGKLPEAVEQKLQAKLEAKAAGAAEKPPTACATFTSLHQCCGKCKGGSAGDGGVEASGGLCREHCSRQGEGYCGTGDDYVVDGLDCRPCRVWVPGADARAAYTLAKVAVAQATNPAAGVMLADDRMAAVCFEPAASVDSEGGGDAAGVCLGGSYPDVPCPTFTSLAVAQATCSRDARCVAVAMRASAAPAHFELRAAAPNAQQQPPLPEQEQAPDEVLWKVATSCEASAPTSTATSPEIYLSVKTSAAHGNHARRPLSLLRSWANTNGVRQDTFFFTDAPEKDPALLALSGGGSHWVDTSCGAARGRALCCKTDAELRGFITWARSRGPRQPGTPGAAARGRWWCHLDDDNYVLLGPLQQFLSTLDREMPYYVGRAGPTKSGNRLHAPFAMGGAGYCLNEEAAVLAAKELKHDEGSNSMVTGLKALCDEIDYPDDMALGVLMTQRLKPQVALTEDPYAISKDHKVSWNGGLFGGRFHSQWEIYGHSLVELMTPMMSAARSGPHEHFVYGWDRQEKKKTSAPRDMLHLHYYLSVVAQESTPQGEQGGLSACYGESQHGPVTADGALGRVVGGYTHTHRFDSVGAAMVGCNRLGAACGVVAAVDIAGAKDGEASGCVYVLFASMPADAGSAGAKGWKSGCGLAWAKAPAAGPCLEPQVYGDWQ